MSIVRRRLLAQVRRALGRARAVVLAGPRQSGKSTLAAAVVPRGGARWFDLEHPVDRDRLQQPLTALEPLLQARPGGGGGPIVIDEVQLAPELFALLRVLIDRSDAPGQFLLLGSASPALLRQTSESLLGRVEVVEVTGFDIEEVGAAQQQRAVAAWRLPAVVPGGQRCRQPGVAACRRCSGTWSPICRSSASTSRRRRCCASGACWRTCMARSGTRPIRRVRWAFPSPPCAATWTC